MPKASLSLFLRRGHASIRAGSLALPPLAALAALAALDVPPALAALAALAFVDCALALVTAPAHDLGPSGRLGPTDGFLLRKNAAVVCSATHAHVNSAMRAFCFLFCCNVLW